MSFKQVQKKISSKNLVQLINCMLLERKIILISKRYEVHALLIEFLLDLISPLNKTVFTHISYLKLEMIDYLDVPMPYIIGISSNIWNKIFMNKWHELSDDTVAFDLDTEDFMPKLEIIERPEPMTTILIETLNDLYQRYENCEEQLSDVDFRIQIKQSLFNYILLTINDYRLHFKLTEA